MSVVTVVLLVATVVAVAALAFAAAQYALAKAKERTFAEKERATAEANERMLAEMKQSFAERERQTAEANECATAEMKRTFAEKERATAEANERALAEMRRTFDAKERATAAMVNTLREQFANLAEQKLRESTEGLSAFNRQRLDEILRPFREEIDKFRRAFDENRQQQVANRERFDQAIVDLGKQALQIGADAENLAKALKSESKTQGDWGEMVLANVLAGAGLKEGTDFVTQAQETDAAGNRLIPDVEIPLPNGEKLLVDSKASVTAYLDYVAATDEAAKERAVKEHLASVRQHMNELADKGYVKKVKGSQGYILMFIPNEGSYLLAMERDRKLATDAFRRHVIIVNPTTLLLCLQIVALLRSREAQNANAEQIAAAAAKMYEKFAGFSDVFADIGKRLDGLRDAYDKARGQLCAGKGNVIRQLEGLKDKGVVVTKSINPKLLDEESGR